ncbi:MAG TPA: MGMT family protein [Thermoanaerobaculia bacterium]|nr:MGMT family protein [Thermoanaerobaculia bacterium]
MPRSDTRPPKSDTRRKIYAAVKRIPRGRVATYGQIATIAGLDGHARQVGYALHDLPDGNDIPWHRVINARGEISPRSAGDSHELQRMLLEAEGVEFDLAGRVALKRYRWAGGKRV